MSFINSVIEEAFSLVSGDVDSILIDARGETINSWTNWQIGKGIAAGGTAASIPGFAYATIPADVLYTIRLMHRSATGICGIEIGTANDETFATILASWTGAIELNESFAHQVNAKIFAKGAAMATGPAATKLAIKAAAEIGNVLVQKKLAPKIAVKLGEKIAARPVARHLLDGYQ